VYPLFHSIFNFTNPGVGSVRR